MTITLMRNFKLSIDEHNQAEDIIEDGLNAIGCITATASACANAATAMQDGSTPNEQIVNEVVYASAVLSDLAQ